MRITAKILKAIGFKKQKIEDTADEYMLTSLLMKKVKFVYVYDFGRLKCEMIKVSNQEPQWRFRFNYQSDANWSQSEQVSKHLYDADTISDFIHAVYGYAQSYFSTKTREEIRQAMGIYQVG